MPLSDEQVRVIRSWVGNSPRAEDLDDRYDALGDVNAVIREMLRGTLARYVNDQPSSITLPSGLSVNYGEGIRALREMLSEFEKLTTGANAARVTRLVRDNYR